MNPAIVVALLAGLVGIVYIIWQFRNVLSKDPGNEKMQEIAAAIQEGAAAFLNREYMYLSVFVVIVAAVLAIFLEWQSAVAFVVGALTSAAAGYLGMYVAVRANVRTAWGASKSLNDGLNVAFSSGSIMGMAVVSFSIIGLTTLYLIFNTGMGVDCRDDRPIPDRLRLRRQQHRPLRPCGRRHLHQGCRCGR